jgi:hypothetical protein
MTRPPPRGGYFVLVTRGETRTPNSFAVNAARLTPDSPTVPAQPASMGAMNSSSARGRQKRAVDITGTSGGQGRPE